LNGLLAAILLGAIALVLGRLRSYYLDENKRIEKGSAGSITELAVRLSWPSCVLAETKVRLTG
jgi:hypothetical protein